MSLEKLPSKVAELGYEWIELSVNLHIEPHPEDWKATLQPSVDLIRTVTLSA